MRGKRKRADSVLPCWELFCGRKGRIEWGFRGFIFISFCFCFWRVKVSRGGFRVRTMGCALWCFVGVGPVAGRSPSRVSVEGGVSVVSSCGRERKFGGVVPRPDATRTRRHPAARARLYSLAGLFSPTTTRNPALGTTFHDKEGGKTPTLTPLHPT